MKTGNPAKMDRNGIRADGANLWRLPADEDDESPATLILNANFIGIRKCYRPDADDGVGGIVLPETAKETTTVCSLEAVGPGCKEFQGDMVGRAYVKASPNRAGANDQFRNVMDPTRETWIVRETVFVEGLAGAIPGVWMDDE